MTQYSDEELLALFRDPEKRNYAYSLLVRQYQERLYFHVRKIVNDHDDANDVVQNTFIKAWKALDRFREDAKLYTWLYRIATNESLTFLKKQKAQKKVSMDDVAHMLSENLESDQTFDGDDLLRRLHEAVDKLPEKQKLVFNMRYFQEMKYEEISQILNTSVGGLKASYHHAVKKIEKYIRGD
ncbi:MAG: sigma-70 family RNA polymerase sigma factor [Bacteroidia bacterium]|nr:sigma-70 family RNA polymerase sigma factor [Bacteroidia bacterium]